MEIQVICLICAFTFVSTTQLMDSMETELNGSTTTLLRNVHDLEGKAEEYLVAYLKRNLFRELRSFLEENSRTSSRNEVDFRRQPRQNEEEEEEDEDTTSSSANSTKRPTIIIPQVANLVKAIFGGNSINVTSYAQAATKFLPPSIGNQVLGVVKLLAHNPSARWSTTIATTPAPTKATTVLSIVRVKSRQNDTLTKPQILRNSSATPSIILVPSSDTLTTKKPGVTTVRSNKVTTEEEDEEEEEESFRQLRLPDLSALFGGTKRTAVNATTESVSGFEEETTSAGGLDLRELASGVRLGLGDLIKIMPDLFKGAREAVGLLSGIQSLLGSFGG